MTVSPLNGLTRYHTSLTMAARLGGHFSNGISCLLEVTVIA